MQTETITYQDGDVSCHGFVAWDESISGPRPGVLISHAWAGQDQFERDKAVQLAEMGYVGFAVDNYGGGTLGSNNDENAALMTPFVEDRAMLRRRLLAGLTAMQSLDVVDTDRCGAMGYCFGGLCALDIARSGADVRGVVSFHGLLNGITGLDANAVRAKVLVQHGNDDPFVSQEQFTDFVSEMNIAGADWQIHQYGGVKHAFTNPAADDHELGTVFNASADRRSWQTMSNFFAEVFAR